MTEYIQGHTLWYLLSSTHPLPEKDALRLASLVCEALLHLHEQGITHRDLKPQNIMICNDGTIRIIDFGIARDAQARRITFTGFTTAFGTPDYMSPERVKGKHGDARTDIYSLGAMLYEMVVGVTPFDCENENQFVIMNARVVGDPLAPRKRNPNVSPQVEQIILHAMERDPGKRYQSSASMKMDLGNPDAVKLTGRCDRLEMPTPWKCCRKNVFWITLGISIPITILILIVLLIIHRGPAL